MGEEDVEVAAETPQAQSSPDNNDSLTERLSRQSSLAYVGQVVSSVILLVALCSKNAGYEDHKYYEYGISVASIAMIFAVIGWLLAFTNKEGTEKIILFNNYFLFVWNFFGACFLTFGGPFNETGNGYFGAWGLVVFATMAMGVNPQLGHGATGACNALIASSIVLMIAISSYGLNKDDANYAELVYSLVLTILTILVMVGTMKGGESMEAVLLYVMALNVILWAVAAGLLTFRGPFLVTGNGYFGAWGGVVASVFGVNAARFSRAQQ